VYDIIPLIAILTSLAVIAAIVSRKFSALANLDVDSIPAEKEARFKEQIISTRLKRNYFIAWSRFAKFFTPVKQAIADFFVWSYRSLLELKEKHESARPVTREQAEIKLISSIDAARQAYKDEDFSAAEKKLIEIIALDPKNIEAFRLLGHVYYSKKELDEAKQVYEHILKLSGDDDDAYFELGHIAREKGNYSEAKEDYLKSINLNNKRVETYFDLALLCSDAEDYEEATVNINKALEIEPNNPRYLDTALNIGIIKKDKEMAMAAYGKLAAVNPDNQKLADLKKQIEEI